MSLRRPERKDGEILREKSIIARNLHRRQVQTNEELSQAMKRLRALEEEVADLQDTVASFKGAEKFRVAATLKLTAKLRTKVFGECVEADQGEVREALVRELEEVEARFSTSELTPNTRMEIKRIHEDGENEKENSQPSGNSASIMDTSSSSSSSFKVLGYMNKTPNTMTTSDNETKRKSPSLIICEKQIASLKKQLISVTTQYDKAESLLRESTHECVELRKNGDEQALKSSTDALISEKQLTSLKREAEERDTTIAGHVQTIERIENCINSARTDLVVAKKQISSLQSTNASLKEDLEGLRETATDQQARIVQSQEQLAARESALRHVREETTARISKLESILLEVQESLSLLQKEGALWAGKKTTLTKANMDLAKSLQKARKAAKDDEAARLVDITSREKLHKAELGALRKQLEEASARYSYKDEEYATSLTTITELERIIGEAHEDKVRLTDEREEATKQAADLRLRLGDASMEAADARDYYEKQTAKTLDGHKDAREKQRRQVELLRSQLRQAEGRVVELEEGHVATARDLREERERSERCKVEAAAQAQALAGADEACLRQVQQQLETSRAEQAGLAERLKAALADVDKTREALTKSSTEHASLKLQFNELEATAQTRRTTMTELEGQCKELGALLRRREEEVQGLLGKERSSGNAQAALTAEVDLLSVQREQTAAQLQALHRQVEEKDRKVGELAAQVREGGASSLRDKDSIRSLEATLASKGTIIEGLNRRVVQLESKTLSLQMSLNEVDSDLRRQVDAEHAGTVTRLKQQVRDGKRDLREMQNRLLEAELHRDAAIEVADKFLVIEAGKGSPAPLSGAGKGKGTGAGAGTRSGSDSDTGSKDSSSPLNSLQELTRLSRSVSRSASSSLSVSASSAAALSSSSSKASAEALTFLADGAATGPSAAASALSTADAEKEVLRKAFCSFLAATSKEDFSDRARLLCSMLAFPPAEVSLILTHLRKFEPYLMAMSVFDSFSVDLSSRFENLLFSGAGTGAGGDEDDGGARGGSRSDKGRSPARVGATPMARRVDSLLDD